MSGWVACLISLRRLIDLLSSNTQEDRQFGAGQGFQSDDGDFRTTRVENAQNNRDNETIEIHYKRDFS